MAYMVGIAGVDALNWAKLKAKLFKSFRVSAGLSSLLSRGEALDEMTRMEMESALGYDLKDVRIHETEQAGELARELQAEAFTIGTDIFTTEGKLNAPTRENRGLLAHELTHVIQQTHPHPVLRSSDNEGLESLRIPGGKGLSEIEGNAQAPNPALQLAPIGPFQSQGNSITGEMEEAAQTAEQVVSREEEGSNRSQTPAVDAEEIAEIVYRLMQQELLLERDRVKN
jgi:hypothetical protein